jgi:hypothetical protein
VLIARPVLSANLVMTGSTSEEQMQSLFNEDLKDPMLIFPISCIPVMVIGTAIASHWR